MAIDYAIEYPCMPRAQFASEGIFDRLKHRERAVTVIRMYREAGDNRPPSEMGFDFTLSTPVGEEATELIVVQDALNYANELDAHAHHCRNCPANTTDMPYGCSGFVQYPISGKAEAWLLNQMPLPHEAPLVWLLLKQGVEKFQYDGKTIHALRSNPVYFEDRVASLRGLGEFTFTADQVFEMIFGVGDIQPNHASMLLLFFHAIPHDLDAPDIMRLTPAPDDADERIPFLMTMGADDDHTMVELKQFFYAMYVAWRLNVPLKLDV